MNQSLPPDSVIGEYRLTGLIGRGGMGEVYRGVHSKIGRAVAVKLLSQTSKGDQFGARFLNEARIQAALHHPNIATLYDFLEYNNQPCIIMEYVEGKTLDDYIRESGYLQAADALSIFRSIVDAINYVHSQGIIHRDIKSNNVKINSCGQVKLLDFGIAKSGSSPQLTVTGGFVGTLQYLPPEQFRGAPADARSDVWALGVLLYEMVTGRMPFEAATVGELFNKVSNATFPPPTSLNPHVPRDLEAIIMRCLRKEPGERYQSALDLLQDVNRANTSPYAPQQHQGGQHYPQPHQSFPPAGTQPQYTHPTAPPQQRETDLMTSGSSSGSKIGIAVAAILVVLLTGFGGLYFLMSDDPAPGPTQTTVKPPQPQQKPSSQSQPQQAQTVRVEIAVDEGRAEVHRNGQMIGTTPYMLDAKPGEAVNLVLKGQGFNDKPVEFTVTENKKVYTFSMEKKQ
ncbi:MAG TPA: serine/threonine-protein kinase [Blastocatellia bacterium]|nr:serine/threonine-protein kinase [Blastocatellia bacterium]